MRQFAWSWTNLDERDSETASRCLASAWQRSHTLRCLYLVTRPLIWGDGAIDRTVNRLGRRSALASSQRRAHEWHVNLREDAGNRCSDNRYTMIPVLGFGERAYDPSIREMTRQNQC